MELWARIEETYRFCSMEVYQMGGSRDRPRKTIGNYLTMVMLYDTQLQCQMIYITDPV